MIYSHLKEHKMKHGKGARDSAAERRRAPRANVGLPLRIKKDRKTFEARTENISSSGAYCTVDKFVPLNSKVDLTLSIPERGAAGREAEKKIRCRGIVVRNRPEESAPERRQYGIALFFTGLASADRHELHNLVQCKLPANCPRCAAAGRRYDPGRVFCSRSFGDKGFCVRSANFKVLGRSIHLSKNGICFQTDRSIPLFHEIAVNLVLPPHPAGPSTEDHEALHCSAIVVGCERLPRRDAYDMAAYFVGLNGEQKERLRHCIEKLF